MDSVRVMIASDNRLYREALEKQLAATNGIVMLSSASSTSEADRYLDENSPAVVLADIAMSDVLTFAKRATTMPNSPRLVAVGLLHSEHDLIASVRAGICGYIARDAHFDEVVTAIFAAARGEVYCSSCLVGSLTRHIAAGPRPDTVSNVHGAATTASASSSSRLTPRESQVAALLRSDLSNKEIANMLRIEPQTVKNHVHRILFKLGVRSRMELVSHARAPTTARFEHNA